MPASSVICWGETGTDTTRGTDRVGEGPALYAHDAGNFATWLESSFSSWRGDKRAGGSMTVVGICSEIRVMAEIRVMCDGRNS